MSNSAHTITGNAQRIDAMSEKIKFAFHGFATVDFTVSIDATSADEARELLSEHFDPDFQLENQHIIYNNDKDIMSVEYHGTDVNPGDWDVSGVELVED